MESSNTLTEGSIPKKIIMFAIPMFLGNLFQQLYNVADSLVVGNFLDKTALAAVTSTGSLIFLIVGFFNGTAMGAGVVIARYFGAKDYDKVKRAVHTDLAFGVACGLLMTAVGVLFAPQILKLMGTPEDIFGQAQEYLNIYFYGFFFLFLYNAFSAVFNALGDSRKPLYFLIFSSVLNIGLDILFVGSFRLGVAGAAWATLIAQAVSAALSFGVLSYKLARMQTESYRRFDGELLVSMTRTAIPTIVQQSMVSIGMLLIQSVVNRFGSIFLAGYTAAVRIDNMAVVPMGAQKPQRAKQGYHAGLVMAMGIGLLIGVLIFFFGDVFIASFMDAETDAASIAVGVQYIGVVSMFYFVMGAMNVTNAVLRGAGDMGWFMGITLVNLATRVLLTYLFADATGGMIIMWANPIGWTVGLVLAFVRYRQGAWKRIKLV